MISITPHHAATLPASARKSSLKQSSKYDNEYASLNRAQTRHKEASDESNIEEYQIEGAVQTRINVLDPSCRPLFQT